MAAHQARPSLGFSRQEHWSGLPLPSPIHESESEVTQSCRTVSDPMDCSPPGSSVHVIFQAKVLEWGAIALPGTQQIQNKILANFDPTWPLHVSPKVTGQTVLTLKSEVFSSWMQPNDHTSLGLSFLFFKMGMLPPTCSIFDKNLHCSCTRKIFGKPRAWGKSSYKLSCPLASLSRIYLLQ